MREKNFMQCILLHFPPLYIINLPNIYCLTIVLMLMCGCDNTSINISNTGGSWSHPGAMWAVTGRM